MGNPSTRNRDFGTTKSIIENVRGSHYELVFTYKVNIGKNINNNSWKRVRMNVGLPQVRVHDHKHTFGRRPRAAGVPVKHGKRN